MTPQEEEMTEAQQSLNTGRWSSTGTVVRGVLEASLPHNQWVRLRRTILASYPTQKWRWRQKWIALVSNSTLSVAGEKSALLIKGPVLLTEIKRSSQKAKATPWVETSPLTGTFLLPLSHIRPRLYPTSEVEFENFDTTTYRISRRGASTYSLTQVNYISWESTMPALSIMVYVLLHKGALK